MKLLPYENYELPTNLAISDVVVRLRENIIVTSRLVSNWKVKTTRPFSGVVAGDSFKLRRITWYANSFAPVITGQIHDVDGKATINVKMVMRTPITLFVIVWMSGVTLALVASIIDMIEQQKFIPASLAVIAFYIVGYGLCLTGFKYESSKSKKILAALFYQG